jgi:TATA-binding protein-associated factor Taf7
LHLLIHQYENAKKYEDEEKEFKNKEEQNKKNKIDDFVMEEIIKELELKIIDYKEAMIFAFLGVLRMRDEINCLSSVTGASQSSCGGTIVQWIDTK